MIRADQIPDEVFYAFQKAWTDQSTLSTKECLAAALNAWPGALVEWHSRGPGIILPLPQRPAMSERSEADCVSNDLVERVARAMWMADPDPYDPAYRIPFEEADWEAQRNYRAEARAAIAVLRPALRAEALEEAAKVASKWQQMYFENENVHVSNITECIVADIRAIANREE